MAGASDSSLPALLDELATRPDSAGRRFSALALLSRYIDLDPVAAISRAAEFQLPVSSVASLYRQWAESDVKAAVRGLHLLADTRIARAAGDELIAILGSSTEAIETIASALPAGIDKASFKALAYGAIARRQPDKAWAQAGAIENPKLRLRAQQLVVEAMGEQDPEKALVHAARIGDRTVRQTASRQALNRWVQTDPAACLEYLASMEGEPPQDWGFITANVYSELALAEPLLLLETVDQLPYAQQQSARSAALNRWAKLDAQAALDYVRLMPPGEPRSHAQHTVATAYARVEPEAALAWAMNREATGHFSMVNTVLTSISVNEPELALQLTSELESPQARSEALIHMTYQLADAGKFSAVASHIKNIEDPDMRAIALDSLGMSWMAADPDVALEWLLDHVPSMSEAELQQAVYGFISNNPRRGAALFDSIPDRARPAWAAAVAQGYAGRDPEAASEWVAQFRGQPGFEDTARFAFNNRKSDPQELLALAQDMANPIEAAHTSAMAVARMAEQEPATAANWAASLDDERARRRAAAYVAEAWVAQDAVAASDWALGLPEGLSRDAAITGLIAAAGAGEPSAELMAAYSSDVARQLGVRQAVYNLGRQDREAAQRVIDRYVTDPTLRAMAQDSLDGAQ